MSVLFLADGGCLRKLVFQTCGACVCVCVHTQGSRSWSLGQAGEHLRRPHFLWTLWPLLCTTQRSCGVHTHTPAPYLRLRMHNACTHMHSCIHTRTRVYTPMCTPVPTHAQTHTRVRTHIYTLSFTFSNTRSPLHIHTSCTCTNTHTHTAVTHHQSIS